MSTLTYLCLLLAAFSTLVSSSSLTTPAVYNNCSGDSLVSPPTDSDSTSFFKPQIPVDGSGAGWEEWLFVSHNLLSDGSVLVYSHKWSHGDPASANASQSAFSVWASFPNGTFSHQIVYDAFKYEEHEDGGFTCSIGNNHLTWDPTHLVWNSSVNANGWIIETHTENVEPKVPFAPSYNSVPGQISQGLFSRIDVPRGHTDGYIVFPWGSNLTVQSVGSLKHTWSNKPIADTISAYVRGSTFLPNLPPIPVASLNWYQTWNPSGKEIDAMQYLAQPDNSLETQVFRIQITNAPDTLSIITMPKPASLPFTYNTTELTLPLCGPGADFENTDQKMKWKTASAGKIFDIVDAAGGVTVYHKVDISGVVIVNGTATEFAGGLGVVELYHR